MLQCRVEKIVQVRKPEPHIYFIYKSFIYWYVTDQKGIQTIHVWHRPYGYITKYGVYGLAYLLHHFSRFSDPNQSFLWTLLIFKRQENIIFQQGSLFQ